MHVYEIFALTHQITALCHKDKREICTFYQVAWALCNCIHLQNKSYSHQKISEAYNTVTSQSVYIGWSPRQFPPMTLLPSSSVPHWIFNHPSIAKGESREQQTSKSRYTGFPHSDGFVSSSIWSSLGSPNIRRLRSIEPTAIYLASAPNFAEVTFPVKG
jgi:hypothetical protein